MRKLMSQSRISMVMAIALAVTMLTFSTPASAAGNTVSVTVHNTTLTPQTATVSVQAVVNNTSATSSQVVVLLPLQTRTVSVSFGGTVTAVLHVDTTCGIADDTTPF